VIPAAAATAAAAAPCWQPLPVLLLLLCPAVAAVLDE